MPEDEVRQFIASLGKGSASRLHAEVFDQAGVVPVDSRIARGSQDLQIYDVVKLAHHFGVSLLSALYRLLNLKLVTGKQFEEMKQMHPVTSVHLRLANRRPHAPFRGDLPQPSSSRVTTAIHQPPRPPPPAGPNLGVPAASA